jgi:hypothetical protein
MPLRRVRGRLFVSLRNDDQKLLEGALPQRTFSGTRIALFRMLPDVSGATFRRSFMKSKLILAAAAAGLIWTAGASADQWNTG